MKLKREIWHDGGVIPISYGIKTKWKFVNNRFGSDIPILNRMVDIFGVDISTKPGSFIFPFTIHPFYLIKGDSLSMGEMAPYNTWT